MGGYFGSQLIDIFIDTEFVWKFCNYVLYSAIGNILIWALTNVNNATRYELAIDLEDWSDNRRFARYRSFRLGRHVHIFRLSKKKTMLFYSFLVPGIWAKISIIFSFLLYLFPILPIFTCNLSWPIPIIFFRNFSEKKS